MTRKAGELGDCICVCGHRFDNHIYGTKWQEYRCLIGGCKCKGEPKPKKAKGD